LINEDLKVYIPCLIDELIIRYIEYIEWYAQRPDKIKHIDYILNYIEDLSIKNKFLNKLHYYTKIERIYKNQPKIIPISISTETNKVGKSKIKKYIEKINSYGLLGIFLVPFQSIKSRLKGISN
jgi:hypothetical protein